MGKRDGDGWGWVGMGSGKVMVCRWVVWEVVDWRERGRNGWEGIDARYQGTGIIEILSKCGITGKSVDKDTTRNS